MKVENDQVKIEQKLFGKRNLQRNLHIYIYIHTVYMFHTFSGEVKLFFEPPSVLWK